MKIAIIGAGIAGLTAAAACARRPRTEVTLFEQAERFTPVGAGIVLWPNAVRALTTLGLGEQLLAMSLHGVTGGIRNSKGKWLAKSNTDQLERRFGPTVAIHRAVLTDLLASAVDPAWLRHGHLVEAVERDGTVRWRRHRESGHQEIGHHQTDSERFDLVVGADGINSRIRNSHWSARPRYSGTSAWRFVLDHYPLTTGCETWGLGENFGFVPLPGDQTYCYAALRVPSGGTSLDLSRFHTWPEPIPDLVRRAEGGTILRHDLSDLRPLRSYLRGKIVLIGDAAHAMLPFLGQGACQGIEDAVELATHLDELATFDRLRVRRASMVQKRSRQAGQLTMSDSPRTARVRDVLPRLIPTRIAVDSLAPVVDWHPSRHPG